MKKILLTMTVVIIAIFMCTGCMSKKLEYDPNLGYDLNNVKNKDVTFNVYHSNTKDHTWELVTSFQCDPKPGHYNDVKIEGKKNKVIAVLSDNTYTESEDGKSASYDGVDLSTYEYVVKGFDGVDPGYVTFDVKDEEGEQFVRLYPITNSGEVSYYEEISLDKPYETDEKIIDNILITIVMK